MMQSRVKFLVRTAVFSVFALVLSYVEALIPISAAVPIPGFKLGLSNIVVAYILNIEPMSALLILILKVFLLAMLFSSPVSLLFSIVGGLFSFSVMLLISLLLKGNVTYLGISAAGAFFHNFGQLTVTAFIYGMNVALAYAAPMLLSGILCGVLLGFILNLFSVRIGNLVKKMY